ncbi:unnamed protein product [Candidula unifasciata]|uniref:Uncharacterized protein n=1 Tax=Candidula unifasciata TaxID=100452 RepID=A0A8S3YYJ5_9EUPU|nr:unnamed protein product [Candidula unifasciata]
MSDQQTMIMKTSSHTAASGRREKQEWNRIVTIKQCSKNNKAKMLTFNVSVLDTCPDDVDQKRSTVVAIHGCPGTGNDFKSLARKLHERGIRLVAPTSLGMTGSPITLDQLSKVDFTTEGRTKTLHLTLEAMNIHRIDILVGHSAGAWTMYKAGASWENVRCLFGINPGGHKPNRTLRPFSVDKDICSCFALVLWKAHYQTFSGLRFKGITTNGDGINLIASQQYVTQQEFANVPLNAGVVRSRKLPVLFTYALNDKIVEPVICSDMAYNVLGIPKENTVMYTDDKTPSRNPFFVPEGWLTRCLIFARGGHIVHVAHEQEIVEQIEDILKHINKT